MSAWSPQPHPAPSRAQVEVALRPALPTVPRRYHAFYRTARNAPYKPLLVALVVVAWVVAMSVIGLIMFAADGTLQRSIEAAQAGESPMGALKVTPLVFLGNNVAVATAILFAMFGQWAIWGQRPKWLSSVVGGFRWGWFFRCVAWFLPFLVAIVAISYVMEPDTDIRWRDYSLLMIVGILVTTPFQAAGEEYMVRGLVQRATASWFRSDVVGWVVSTIVGGAVFVSIHLATDPWLNAFYFLLAGLLSWLAWRTGGLEASVALHIVNNMVAEALMPFTDFSGVFDRSVGAGSPAVLVHLAVVAVPAALVVWQARRLRVVEESAPGAADIDAALAQWGAVNPPYGGGPNPPPPPGGGWGVR